MTCEWDDILNALVAYLTTQLQAVYSSSPDAFATADLTRDLQLLDAGYTPAIGLWQHERRQPDPDVPVYHRSITLVGFIRRTGWTQEVMQTEGNRLERYLDAWFASPQVLGSQQVSIFHASGQTSSIYAGADECVIEYTVTVRYREAL